MDSVAVESTASVEILQDLIGAPARALTVWAGKPNKTGQRIFAHVATPNGRLWFAKISRDDQGGLLGEFEAMQKVQAMLTGTPFAAASNQVVRYKDGVLVQEWRRGTSFRELLISSHGKFWRRPSIARDCLAIIDWLAGFHALGAAQTTVSRTIDELGAAHGDFKPSNILLRSDTPLVVVDWELFDSRSVQIHDVFHFLIYFGMTVTAPDRTHGLRMTVFEKSWISEIARSCLCRYLAALECRSGSLNIAFAEYIETTLRRRSLLGLSNDRYFLVEARKIAAGWNGTPYAFRPLPAVECRTT